MNTASSSPDVDGTFTDEGNNLIVDSTGSTGFTVSSLVGDSTTPIDPLLGSLQNNGGSTETQAILPGSPAINVGSNPNSLTTDQRGEARIQRGAIDIGAFESDLIPPPTSGDDVITLTSGNDTIDVLAGNDTVRAKGGRDNIFGNDGEDRLFGQGGRDTLDGGADNDRLNGGNGNDLLIGGTGNDNLTGGNGEDILIGVDESSANPGLEERDTLRDSSGGGEADLFILGNSSSPFYLDNGTTNAEGNASRATIINFEVGIDLIQLNGIADNYLLRETNSGNTNIFYRPTGQPRDLIGIVRNTTGLDLSDPDSFSFV